MDDSATEEAQRPGTASIIGDSASTTDGSASPYRAYAPAEFLPLPQWRRLQAILAQNGGAFGVTGPRGAGKTWLMRRAIDEIEGGRSGVGLWFPSPSEYDGQNFLVSLLGLLADRAENHYRDTQPLRVLVMRRLTMAYSAMVVVAFAIAGTLSPTVRDFFGQLSLAQVVMLVVLYSAALVIVVMLLGQLSRTRLERRPAPQMLRQANLVRERIRYSATLKSGSSAGGALKRFGMEATLSRSQDKQLVERPVTLSSLVHDFRSLSEAMVNAYGSVVIALDELDKMADSDKVRALLRDIKGIFEVKGVYFLVSVSYEAAETLSLGAVAGRNEFNSSFYTVIDVGWWSPSYCETLATNRLSNLPPGLGAALGVLSGGIPREVVRLLDGNVRFGSGVVEVERVKRAAIVAVLASEVSALLKAVIAAPAVTARQRLAVYSVMGGRVFDEDVLTSLVAEMPRLWSPVWTEEAWDESFGEEWRRVLVRAAVAEQLIQMREGDRTWLENLQKVVRLASESSHIALAELEALIDSKAIRDTLAVSTEVQAPGGLRRLAVRILSSPADAR